MNSSTSWPIVIKPTAAKQGKSCYECPKSIYLPDWQTMLNIVGAWEGGTRIESIKIVQRAEIICEEFEINILGGVFISFLEASRRLKYRPVFTALVDESRTDIIHLLYADLQLLDPSDPRKQRIYLNNKGRFVVLTMETNESDDVALGALLNSAKNRYRILANAYIRRSDSATGDHLIHVPSDDSESVRHLEALASAAHGLSSYSPTSGGKWESACSKN